MGITAVVLGFKALLTVALGIVVYAATKFHPFAAMGVAAFLVDLTFIVLFSEVEEPTD